MHDAMEIADLERRIAAALDRIGRGLDNFDVPAPAVSGDDVDALREALEAERATSAQLAERLRTVKDRESAARTALEAQVADLTGQLAALQSDRAAEHAEMTDILAALGPLVNEAAAHA